MYPKSCFFVLFVIASLACALPLRVAQQHPIPTVDAGCTPLSCSEMISLVQQNIQDSSYWNDMLCIAYYESSYCPTAQNPSSGASGLWQIMPNIWLGQPGCPPKGQQSQLFDPQANAKCANTVLTKQGLTAWSTWDEGDCNGWNKCTTNSSTTTTSSTSGASTKSSSSSTKSGSSGPSSGSRSSGGSATKTSTTKSSSSTSQPQTSSSSSHQTSSSTYPHSSASETSTSGESSYYQSSSSGSGYQSSSSGSGYQASGSGIGSGESSSYSSGGSQGSNGGSFGASSGGSGELVE